MGLRRLRGRLDQLQGEANLTMAQAQALLAVAEALVEDLADGVGITVNVDAGAAKTIMGIMLGKAGKLPLSVQIDPTVDTLPSTICDFVGGSHDGKRYSIADTANRQIKLKGPNGPELYEWDGKAMRYLA